MTIRSKRCYAPRHTMCHGQKALGLPRLMDSTSKDSSKRDRQIHITFFYRGSSKPKIGFESPEGTEATVLQRAKGFGLPSSQVVLALQQDNVRSLALLGRGAEGEGFVKGGGQRAGFGY